MRYNYDNTRQLGIYVHIPFCRSKCAYCDFNSIPNCDDAAIAEYMNAVNEHIKTYKGIKKSYIVNSIYIGGGTPTYIPVNELIKLLNNLKKTFRLSGTAEISMECNPATVDLSQLKALRKAGVNRLSIGLQTGDNDQLKILGRPHDRKGFYTTYLDARNAGFTNINVDLMFGIPNQSYDSLMQTVSYVCKLKPDHISLYNLRIEDSTPFGKNRKAVEAACADEDTQYAMYLGAIELLKKHGYDQYEISNFAKYGHKCIHNLKYWNCEEYLGFGVSAHSYFNNNRFSVIPNIKKYIEGTRDFSSGESIIAENEQIESRERIGEYIMLRMRLTDGIDSYNFLNRFGINFEETYGEKLKKYIKLGYVKYDSGIYSFTPAGMFISNYILSDILEFADLGHYTINT